MSHSSSATSIQRKAGRGLKLKSAHKVHEEHTSQKCYDRYKSKACLLAPIHYSAASWKGLRGIQKSLLSEKHDICWKGTFFNSSVCLSSFIDVLNRRCMSLFIIYFFTYFLQKYPVITQINIVQGNSGHRPQFENCRAGLDWSDTIILHQCHIVCIFKATSPEFLEMNWPDELMNWSVLSTWNVGLSKAPSPHLLFFFPRENKSLTFNTAISSDTAEERAAIVVVSSLHSLANGLTLPAGCLMSVISSPTALQRLS